MSSGTPAHGESTEHEIDIYHSISGPQDTLTITTTVSTAYSPEDTALSPFVAPLAPSSQSPLDSHNIADTPILLPDVQDLFLSNDLFLGRPQVWEHSGSLFDERIDNGISMIQNYHYGPDMDVTQYQLPQFHPHLPQIDWGSSQEPPLPYSDETMMPAWFLTRPPEGSSISVEVAPGLDVSLGASSNVPLRTIRPPAASRAAPSQPRLPRGTPVPEERRYDRPGKKPAAPSQPDALKLEEYCRHAGGSAFAVDWIIPTFKYGVTAEALLRVLKRTEINEMNFAGGFEPHQAYDGFISKVGERYECELCKEGRRTQWKNKKDAPRHLRKFHFGIADVCNACGKDVFSKAEMKTHRCARRAEDDPQAGSSGTR